MWTTIQPIFFELIASVLGVIASAVLVSINSFVRQKAGDEASETLMFLLHRSLETGVKAAQNATPDATAESIVKDAIAHATQSIPDTIAKLNPTAQVLINIAMSKLTAK